MHRTLKQATAKPPQATVRLQQKAFDAFRCEFNQHRPHEAPGDLTPAVCYQASTRLYPRRVPEMHYADEFEVRRVSQQGSVRWKGERTFISEVFRYEPLGLKPRGCKTNCVNDVLRIKIGRTRDGDQPEGIGRASGGL
jgi:hypothetical protein